VISNKKVGRSIIPVQRRKKRKKMHHKKMGNFCVLPTAPVNYGVSSSNPCHSGNFQVDDDVKACWGKILHMFICVL
jgi:hypothetical protein